MADAVRYSLYFVNKVNLFQGVMFNHTPNEAKGHLSKGK